MAKLMYSNIPALVKFKKFHLDSLKYSFSHQFDPTQVLSGFFK
jgi:hypothetical protein